MLEYAVAYARYSTSLQQETSIAAQRRKGRKRMSEKRKRKRKGEREDGRIQVTATVGVNPDTGKPIRKSFYGHTRAEAEGNRDNYMLKYERGGVPVLDGIAVSDWMNKWVSLYKLNVGESHLKSLRSHMNRLQRDIGHVKVVDVRPSMLQAALNRVSGMSYSTVVSYYGLIKQIFSKARINKIILDDPSEGLVLPPNVKGGHRALERWESDCILSNWQMHRAGLWAMVMMLAGLRRGELLALRWENIDMQARQIKVCEAAEIISNQVRIKDHTKTLAGMRTVPICRPLYEALSTVPEGERTGGICHSASGAKLTESGYMRNWKTFCAMMERAVNNQELDQRGKRNDLYPSTAARQFSCTAQDLRHTFATALYDADVPVKAAQYYLGHNDVRVTLDLYTHLSREQEKASSSKMTAFLDSWLERIPHE